ncbi:proton-conducting transporter membrane subunit [Myroides ceti]|uniref:Proton-conducting transporter membrane subunit n=1 Tax=Paenimyroides ceti TaxID=395087 RepID=A0ABT8D101_9FLAO|nr:proton-conducting transporter membrane subunit [Paenimyroides ceti]MDN3707074.1 proton-conducting transporter membrane subunit [Paenimyroides ceti]MDN3708909.1 proton-conducting transporter membrane subunit [Paenimyroides ceti]
MTTNFILAPILMHMLTAIMLLFFWQRVQAQKVISIIGNSVAFLMCIRLFNLTMEHGHLVLQVGNWQAPFGITFVSDTLSAVMVLLTAIVSLGVGIYSTAGINVSRIKFGYFFIYHFLIMGLLGSFLTGDIFNLYVWFEVVIISSFILLTVGGKKMQMEGAIKYVTMNMLASVIFLTAIGILYGITGSLNIADLAGKVAAIENRGLVTVTSLLFFVGFGIKSSVFPLYFWLPSSYHTPPSAIAAIFGGLLTKMGVYALFRVFTVIFQPDYFTLVLFSVIAILTMFTGALGTINKRNIRRILSYLIVCHIGYLIAGLGLYTELAFAGVVFYLIHDVIVKSNVFMITGVLFKIRETVDMQRLGGLYKDYPKLSFVIAIVLFSLVGIPPLSGFWPKILLFQEAFKDGQFIMLGALIFASFVTLYVIARLWAEIFWKDSPKPLTEEIDHFAPFSLSGKIALVLPIVALAGVSLFIGLNANAIMEVSNRAAHEMMNPTVYINAVLGTNK